LRTVTALILSFGLGSSAFAQPAMETTSISGVWNGTMIHGSGGLQQEWQIELDIRQSGASLTGTTMISAGDATAVFELAGRLSSGTLELDEPRLLTANPLNLPWCLERHIVGEWNPNLISGTWTSITPNCVGGRLEARRRLHAWGHTVLDLRNRADFDGKKYYVGFVVQPGSSAGFDVGHAHVVWIVDDAVHRATTVDSRGFYSRGNMWTILANGGAEPGEVRIERTGLGKPEWSLLTRVNREQYDASHEVTGLFRDAGYSLTVRDCQTFAIRAATLASVPKVPARDSELTPMSWFRALAAANRPLANRSVPVSR
jgi:hypothetical protein